MTSKLDCILKQKAHLIHKIFAALLARQFAAMLLRRKYQVASLSWHSQIEQSLYQFPGFRFANFDEIPACWRLVKDRVNSPIAPLSVVSSVNEIHRNAIALFDDKRNKTALNHRPPRVNAVAFLLFLNPSGIDAINTNKFTGMNVDPEWLCAPDDKPHASYLWSVASDNSLNGFRVARLCQHLSATAFSDIDQYATIATSAGLRLARLLGLKPIEDSGTKRKCTFYVRERVLCGR